MMYHWTGMPGYGLVHWVGYPVAAALLVYPISRILKRIGLSPFWAFLALVPLVNLVGLWLLAFLDWPVSTRQS